MTSGKRIGTKLINSFKNDKTFGTLDIKTFAYIALTIIIFQMGENVSSVFDYVGIVVMLVGLLVIDHNQIVFAYIVFSASNRLLNVGNNIPLLPILTIVYMVREYILKKGYKKYGLDTQMLIILAIYILYSMRFFFVDYSFGVFIKTAKLIFSFVMLIDAFKKCSSKDEVKTRFNQLIFYLSFGLTITVFISAIFSSTSNSLDRFSISVDSGANVLGIYVSCAIGAATVMLLSDNTLLLKRVMGLLIIPMAYIGLLTQSRTFVVLMIIMIAWVLIFGFKNDYSRNATVAFAVVGVVVALIFIIFFKNTEIYGLINTIIERFINPRNDDVSGGRTRLAQEYLRVIFSSWKYILFGSDGSLGVVAGGVVAHNMYIEVLYGNGFVGAVIVFAIYTVFFRKIRDSFVKVGFDKAHIEGALPFILCFVGGLSSHTILGVMPTNEFFIGVCAIYYYHTSVSAKGKNNIEKRNLYQTTYNFQKS